MDFDFDTAKQIVDLTRSSATTLEAAVASGRSIKSLFTGTKAPPVADVREAIATLNEQILDAREANIKLRELANQLRGENLELKRTADKFAEYELWETAQGAVVLRSTSKTEPTHYLCPNCKDHGEKTILQGDRYIKNCKRGHGNFDLERRPPLEPLVF